MGMQNIAKRRRRQARNGYTHVSRIADGRPIYCQMSAEKSAARLRKKIETEKRMRQNKAKKG